MKGLNSTVLNDDKYLHINFHLQDRIPDTEFNRRLSEKLRSTLEEVFNKFERGEK